MEVKLTEAYEEKKASVKQILAKCNTGNSKCMKYNSHVGNKDPVSIL